MSTSYHDIIAAAEELSARGESDALLRTAVNRYYYGTLWLVRELFINSPSGRNAYTQARDELSRRTKDAFGKAYQELYDLRIAADYRPQEGQWQRKVVRADRLHGQIVAELQRRSLLTASS